VSKRAEFYRDTLQVIMELSLSIQSLACTDTIYQWAQKNNLRNQTNSQKSE